MPVIEKTSSGQTNGESTGEPIKDNQPAKVKQAEPLVLQQPANQVLEKDRYMEHKANSVPPHSELLSVLACCFLLGS